MGFSHSWIAVRGLGQDAALEALGMASFRELEPNDFPDHLGMGQLPGGWLLVLSSDFDDAFKGRLAALASLGPAVACAVEEHVMYSEARGYNDGGEVWRVVSNCEEEDQIAVTGEPPGAFLAIHADARKEQDTDSSGYGADYLFDVPPKVAEAVCGFRLGEPDPEGLRFTELRKAARAKPTGPASGDDRPGFFARLFGRR